MRGVSTAFWSIVLLGSGVSIAAGFAGGRSIGSAGSLPPRALTVAALPAPIVQKLFVRRLVGPHSLDSADGVDPYADPSLGVAWDGRRAPGFDARRDRAKIAVIVIDAGRAGGGALDAFVNSPLPFAFVVGPGDDGVRATCATIRSAGKSIVVDGSTAAPRAVAALLQDAPAVIASLDDARARALMHTIGRRTLVLDAVLGEDDAVGAAARATDHPTLTRDVIADGRDDAPYVEFMLRDALAIAERTGRAIVAIHARTASFDALVRFADRAQRDGADLVPLSGLDT